MVAQNPVLTISPEQSPGRAVRLDDLLLQKVWDGSRIDASEAKAIDAVFGEHKPLVSSTKSMTGHECWMAGASEIVYSVLMMQNSFVAPNINFQNPDEDSAKLNIAKSAIEKDIVVFLSNSFGFGGTNSSLIVRKLI